MGSGATSGALHLASHSAMSQQEFTRRRCTSKFRIVTLKQGRPGASSIERLPTKDNLFRLDTSICGPGASSNGRPRVPPALPRKAAGPHTNFKQSCTCVLSHFVLERLGAQSTSVYLRLTRKGGCRIRVATLSLDVGQRRIGDAGAFRGVRFAVAPLTKAKDRIRRGPSCRVRCKLGRLLRH